MPQRSRAWPYAVLALALIAGLTLLWHERRGSEAAAANQTIITKTTPPLETNKIEPADVLGTGVQWAPLTGDGSN